METAARGEGLAENDVNLKNVGGLNGRRDLLRKGQVTKAAGRVPREETIIAPYRHGRQGWFRDRN